MLPYHYSLNYCSTVSFNPAIGFRYGTELALSYFSTHMMHYKPLIRNNMTLHQRKAVMTYLYCLTFPGCIEQDTAPNRSRIVAIDNTILLYLLFRYVGTRIFFIDAYTYVHTSLSNHYFCNNLITVLSAQQNQ